MASRKIFWYLLHVNFFHVYIVHKYGNQSFSSSIGNYFAPVSF